MKSKIRLEDTYSTSLPNMTAIEQIFLQKEIIGIETNSFTIGINEFLHSGERRETDHYDRADRHRTSLRREYIFYKERNQSRTSPLPIVRATPLLIFIDISFSMRERNLYEGLPCLGNFCFSFRQHEHKNGIPSDRRASTFIEEAKRFAGGGTFEAILKLRIQRPIN